MDPGSFASRKGTTTLRALVLTLAGLLAFGAAAQEPLNEVLQRGYARNWLISEPVAVSTGLAAAAARETDPLAGPDPFAPAGGAHAVRPRAGQVVNTTAGRKKWLAMTAASPLLNVDPLADAPEGVILAACYLQVTAKTDAYLELESPVGARVYVNGVLGRRLRPAPLPLAGVDRFVVSFAPGTNLVVIEAPIIALDALAAAYDTTAQALRSGPLANRPEVAAANGRAVSLRLRPVNWLGDLAYVPRLEPAGTFSGSQLDPRQDHAVTFFNPRRADAASVRVSVLAATMGEAFSVVVPPVPGESQVQAIAPVSVAGRAPGDTVAAEVRLEADSASARFVDNVVVAARPDPGTVYVLTGNTFTPGATGDRNLDVDRRLDAFRNQMAVLERQDSYGFFLGAVEDWQPLHDAAPELRERLRRAVAEGRCGSHAGFTVPDERVVSGETLARNLLYGHVLAQSMLGAASRCYYAWNAPGLAPQSPNLFQEAALTGVLTNLPAPGMAPLALHIAPADRGIVMRRKLPTTGIGHADALRRSVSLQRRPLLEQGWSTDVAVLETALAPPAFALEEADRLAASLPAVRLHGTAEPFFEDVALTQRRATSSVPIAGHYLNGSGAPALQEQPSLVQAFSQTESLLLVAERFATVAALAGARYPGDSLDAAWRSLLWCSPAARLGAPEDSALGTDVYRTLHHAAATAGEVARAATEYLARQADVYAGAPDRTEGVQALVVFNPSGRARTDVCESVLAFNDQRAFQIVDSAGQPVPFEVLRLVQAAGRIRQARVRIVATDVPAMGHTTYYAVPARDLPKPSFQQGAQIENEYLRVVVDPAHGGAIVSLQDKRSGAEHAAGLLDDVVAFARGSAGAVRASAFPARVEAKRMDAVQRLTITTSFLGGTLVRELALYPGVPRLDCTVRFEDVTAGGRPLGVSFATPGQGRSPVYGERFGAVAGRAETGGDIDGLHPFLGWFALGSGDHLAFGEDGALPLVPALIIHGEAAPLRDAAQILQRALVNRGIPSLALPDGPPAVADAWDDSTLLPDLDDYLRTGGFGMQIVLGDASSNLRTRMLVPESDREALHGAVRVLAGAAPSVVVSGDDAWVAAQAEQMAAAIAATGTHALPPQPHLDADTAARVPGGLAVLTQSSRVARADAQGRMTMLLDASTARDGETASDVFHYALYPFNGTWRGAGIAHAAHESAEPLVGVSTSLHVGPLPPQRSVIDAQHAGYVLTAFKPEGVGSAARRGVAPDPRNGIVLRGYIAGDAGDGAGVRFWAPLRSAQVSTVLENEVERASFDGSLLHLRTKPFEVVTHVLRFVSTGARGTDDALESSATTPALAQYWQHGAAVPPRGNLPLTLSLRGPVGGSGGAVTLTVANNLRDRAQEGVVRLLPAEGWTVSPDRVPFTLAADEWREVELVTLPAAASAGAFALYAVAGEEGRETMAILASATPQLDVSVAARGPEVHVFIENRSPLAAIGVAELILPPAYWNGWIPPPVVHAPAHEAPVRVAPFNNQRLVFRVEGGNVPRGGVIHLAAAGQTINISLEAEEENR